MLILRRLGVLLILGLIALEFGVIVLPHTTDLPPNSPNGKRQDRLFAPDQRSLPHD
jgi:hypothetical protein